MPSTLHLLCLLQVWTSPMYTENYKRDKITSAIVAVNRENINSHRTTLRQKKQVKEQLETQAREINSLKKDILELKELILSNSTNQNIEE